MMPYKGKGCRNASAATERREVMKRSGLRVFCAAILSSLLLASCAGHSPTHDTTAAPPASDTSAESVVPPETDAPETLPDRLPETSFDGYTFHILCMEELSDYYIAEPDDTAHILASAVFERNTAVEERFECAIDYVPLPGFSAGSEGFMAAIVNSVQAASGDYDIVAPNYWYGITLSTQGCYLNLHERQYLDFDNPWWAKGYNDTLTIDGRLFACTGDYDLQQYSSLLVTFFNQKLLADNQLEDPYALVREGRWTFDEMLRMSTAVLSDLDGNGRYNDADLYGLIINKWAIRGLYTAFDMKAVTQDEAEGLKLTLYNEKSVEAYEKVYALVNDTPSTFKSRGGYIDNDRMLEMFKNDQGLFFGVHLGIATSMRDMESDYGVLPQPKYTEEQKSYLTGSVGATIFAIPTSLETPDASALLLEALCMESYRRVVPVYYESILKYRDARDADSTEMIDLVHDTLFYDFGYVWDTALGNPYISFGDNIVNKQRNFASWYASKTKLFDRKLSSLSSDLAKW